RRVSALQTRVSAPRYVSSRNAPPIAMASSSRAIGRSLPAAFESRARSSEPPSVPATAPSTPIPSPPIRARPAARTAAPLNPPVTSRAMKPMGALRLGVVGSLSTISSAIAQRLRTYGVAANPRKASGVVSSRSQPRRAAQLTTAGAVIERSPAMTPISSAVINGDMLEVYFQSQLSDARVARAQQRPEIS